MLNSTNMMYLLIVAVVLIGFFVWKNFNQNEPGFELSPAFFEMPDYHWTKTKDGVYVLNEQTGKSYYNEQSLQQAYENTKKNRHEYATEEAYNRQLSMFKAGLIFIEDSNTQKESSNNDSKTR